MRILQLYEEAICLHNSRERDCKGDQWENEGDAPTVPSFLNDHIWSFRNKCRCNIAEREKCITICMVACGLHQVGSASCAGACSKFYYLIPVLIYPKAKSL